MLTGCPGIFAVFIFIIQFVVRKNVNRLFSANVNRAAVNICGMRRRENGLNHTRLSAFWTREEAVLTTQNENLRWRSCPGKQNSVSPCRRLFGEDSQG